MAESQLIGGGTQPPRRPTGVKATSQAYRCQPICVPLVSTCYRPSGMFTCLACYNSASELADSGAIGRLWYLVIWLPLLSPIPEMDNE